MAKRHGDLGESRKACLIVFCKLGRCCWGCGHIEYAGVPSITALPIDKEVHNFMTVPYYVYKHAGFSEDDFRAL
jgi:hypothetical protein